MTTKDRVLSLLLVLMLMAVNSGPGQSSNIQPQQAYRNLFTMTGTATVANTASELTLVGSGIGVLSIPANTVQIGSTFHVKLWGIHSATANPNVTVRVKVGGATILTTGAVATGNSTNQLFAIEVYAVVLTTGVGGTIFIQGEYQEYNNGNSNTFSMTTTTPTTVNTTVTNALDITYQYSVQALGNTLTSTNGILDQFR